MKLRLILLTAVTALVFLILVPLLLYLASRFLDEVLGVPCFLTPAQRIMISMPLIVMGLVFAGLASLELIKSGGAPVFRVFHIPPSKLVTTGPYRYTRNPILFGAFLYFLGVSTLSGSYIMVGLSAVFFTAPLLHAKFVEEPELLRFFGEDYRKYREATPFFLPIRRRH